MLVALLTGGGGERLEVSWGVERRGHGGEEGGEVGERKEVR